LKSKLNSFSQLHFQSTPLILNNVWDAASAAIVANSGAKAIATSSASIAWANGYADGSHIPNLELINAVKRIRRVTDLPFTVDIENGYSGSLKEVCDLVSALIEIGVEGINLEDGTEDPTILVNKIKAIKHVSGEHIFINARTDVYFQSVKDNSQAAEEAVSRLSQYIQAGADGLFIPGLLKIETLKPIVDRVCKTNKIPINVMIPSVDYDIAQLSEIGIGRFSTGPSPFINAYNSLCPTTKLDFGMLNNLFQFC